MSSELGCATKYSVTIARQTGVPTFLQLDEILSVEWNRVLNETSTATVVIAKEGQSPECCRALGELDVWGYEAKIYRDTTLVWEGPIYNILEESDKITLQCFDVVGYLDVRGNSAAYNTGGVAFTVISLMSLFINDVLAEQDPGIGPYLDISTGSAPAATLPFIADIRSFYIGQQLRKFAEYGLDFTTVGRQLIITTQNLENQYDGIRLPILQASDFDANLQLVVAGQEVATRVTVHGTGVFASGSDIDGQNFYGIIDRIIDEDNVTTSGQALSIINNVLLESSPSPKYIVVPDGARLEYDAPITIKELVCNRVVRVMISDYCRKVSQIARIVRVKATWNADFGESVGVSLSRWKGAPLE